MGKLIKNHWARLMTLSAAACRCPTPRPSPYDPRHVTLHLHQTTAPVTVSPVRSHITLLTFSSLGQLLAAIEAFFWPKILFDYRTTALDAAVKPYPILQSINVLFALVTLAFEWPLPILAGTWPHRSIALRVFWLTLASLSCVLMYQSTHPFVYYLISAGMYLWALCEGEVICAKAWAVPARDATAGKV